MHSTYTGSTRPEQTPVDGRLNSPSTLRNIGPILDVLREFLPETGDALEIASGTGEHSAAFAKTFPGIYWRPTDVAPERLRSIDAWHKEHGQPNVAPAANLNVEQETWPVGPRSMDVAITVNLLHLIPTTAMEAAFRGVASVLKTGGVYCIYGPFSRAGAFVSPGDADFHQQLVGMDPAIGYKDVEDVERLADRLGFKARARRDMPANNIMIVLERLPT